MLDIYTEIVNLRREGRPAVLVTVVAREGHIPTELQSKMLVDASGRLAGTVGGGAIEHHALADAQKVLAGGQPVLQEYLLDDAAPADGDTAQPTGMICGGRVTLFYEVLAPADRAYLFGAGHVNRALGDYLAPLGFAVTFLDTRPELLDDLAGPDAPARAMPARTLPALASYGALPDLPALSTSYVVVATHSHDCDEQVLQALLAADVKPRYLGVVASRRKREQMTARLGERLGRTLDLGWVHMPVGLHLGGNTPAAVALSIAAEMQACRHGITGHQHMRDRR